MAPSVPTVTLTNGYKMPMIGLGTWQAGPGEVTRAVKDAIAAGYRHIDCALVYQNEAEVGAAILQKISDGTVKREEIFVTTKLWNTYHRPDLVVPVLKKQLKDMQLSYVDLYLIHWPMGYKEDLDLFPKHDSGEYIFSEVDYIETWKAMEEGVKQGLCRSIGVSNFNSEQIDRLLANCAIKPVNNQVECHPYLNQQKLFDFCTSRGITLTAYSPLGSPTRPWAEDDQPVLLDDPKLKPIAAKYKKSVAQILLRYQVQRNLIVIPKSSTKARIESNFQIFDFELSKTDMEELAKFDCNGRYCAEVGAATHPLYPFNIPF